jgi:hypothetical protein
MDIAWELVLYLGISPSQIAPNAWRYLFASFILWHTVLEARMTIAEFFMCTGLPTKEKAS